MSTENTPVLENNVRFPNCGIDDIFINPCEKHGKGVSQKEKGWLKLDITQLQRAPEGLQDSLPTSRSLKAHHLQWSCVRALPSLCNAPENSLQVVRFPKPLTTLGLNAVGLRKCT